MDTNKGIKIITHASAFFAPILVPLLVWLITAERELREMALQALLFHIGLSLLIGISVIFSFFLIGLPFLVVFAIMGIYYPIKGIIYSLNDTPFSYPVVGRMMK